MKTSGRDTVSCFKQLAPHGQEHQAKTTEAFLRSLGKFADKEPEPNDIPLVPIEGDYAYFQFRQLSAGIVGGGSWKATDFSNEMVLKASMPKLRHVPAYKNHYQVVGEEIGYIGEPTWTQAYTSKGGILVPAGIDAPFVIDKVSEAKLIRKLSGPVPLIKAASVSVEFEWEASHEFEREYDFYYHMGEMIDGTMVRRVATNIINYYESSLVWQGADPWARMIKEGELVGLSREHIGQAVQFSNDPLRDFYQSKRKYFIFDGIGAELNFSFSKSDVTSEQNQKAAMEKLIIEAIALSMGMQAGQITPELLKGYKVVKAEEFTALEGSKTQVENLTKEKQTLTEERDKLKLEKAELEKFKTDNEGYVEAGKQSLEALRTQAKDMYQKFSNGKPEEVILKELETADRVSLEAKVKMFGGKLYDTFGASCTACGSTEISMRSSKEEGEGENGSGSKKTEPVTQSLSLAERHWLGE